MPVRIRTPVYKNTGSVARDHLASERTFLAWMRTGLGFIALGIAIERFSQLDLTEILTHVNPGQQAALASHFEQSKKRGFKEQSDLLVPSLLGTGSGSIVYGTARYFSNLRLLERGLFRPAFHGVGFLSVAVAGLAGGVYYSAMESKRDRQRSL